MPCYPYLHPVQCQLHPRALGRAGISSSRCRACSGRAQSARFARARTTPTRRTAALDVTRPWSLCIAEPRTSRPPAPRSLWCPAAPLAAPLAARRRRQRIPPRTAPPKPPAHDSCPGAQAVLILPLVGTRSSPPRCPATTATAVAGDPILGHRGNLPRALYKGSPSPSEHSRDFRHSS